MLKRLLSCYAMILSVSVATVSLSAMALAGPPASKVRVLLTYGGHDFQEKEFFAMWDNLPGVSYSRAPLPHSADLLRPGLERKFDAIVCYDMVKELSPEQRQDFLKLLDRGIGLVSLHHNLCGNMEWPEYHKVIGGTWLGQKRTIDGREYGPSTFNHGQEISVKIHDREHPITMDLKDFVIQDETYGNTYVSPSVHVLLKADHPGNVAPFAWTTQYGKSRVVYLQAGHDAEAWKNSTFQQILTRSIHWVAGKE